MIRSPLMTVMTDAVMKASRSLKRDFGEVENLQVSRKGPGDFVSAADRKAEKILREALEKARPGYGFVMEEERRHRGHRPEPSLAYRPARRHHELPARPAAIRDLGRPRARRPDRRRRDLRSGQGRALHRRAGKGAYLNNRRIRVAARSDMADAVVACGLPHIGKGDHGLFLREAASVMAHVGGMRRWGAAALDLAYVACGRFDAYWERGLNSWDIAAGILLIREAGGFVSDADGGSDPLAKGSIACGNEIMHRELLKLLKKAKG